MRQSRGITRMTEARSRGERRSGRWPAFALASTLLFSAACGDDGASSSPCAADCGDGGADQGKNGPPPAPVTQENALSTLAAALCDEWFDCPCGERQYSWMSKETCRGALTGRWQSDFDAHAADGFQIDTHCVDQQIAAYRTLRCTSEAATRADAALLGALADLDYCHAVTGGLPEGASCEFIDTSHLSLDACAAGLRCDNGSCVRKLPGNGEPCADGQCSSGFQCNYVTMQCELPQPTQSPCGDCGPDKYCLTTTASMCVPRAGVGDDCLNSVCVDSAYCDWKIGKCTAWPAAGEPCLVDQIITSQGCASGLWCKDSVCEALPGVGQPCAAITYGPKCAEGLVCPYGSSTCQASGPAGSPCEDDSTCDMGLTCVNGTCGTQPPLVCD